MISLDKEEDIEKIAIDCYFDDININKVPSLNNVLLDYLSITSISSKKYINERELLFSQTENGILYRGYIRIMYLDCSRFKNLKKCLYITHVITSPRRGKIMDRDLRRILNESNIDSIYIESILSDKVLESFISKGWIKDNSSVILKKDDI